MTKAVNLAAFGSDVVAPTGDAPIYSCRAWVNFNGQGTIAIRASGNVSSLTDIGVGDYRINLATAMPDANYAVASCGDGSGISSTAFVSNTDERTTTTLRVMSVINNTKTDAQAVMVSVFR